MMNLKPWRKVMTPHDDVISGESRMADFAADLTQVVNGTAPDQYQNPALFYQYTYITEGTRSLLINVAKRISGKGGDPVIQLQTGFGGGKTHTMLAVYHMAKGEVKAEFLLGLGDVLNSAGLNQLPACRVAVLDGVHLGPSEPKRVKTAEGEVSANTLWGVLAAQLCGASGFELVKESDETGVSPGKTVLIDLLKKAAPCVILVDELVAYVRQFNEGEKLRGGTYASNLSFVQALTEAVKDVGNTVLLASLPESVREVGGDQGQKTLEAVSQHFGRLQALWKPVEKEESFEIVRRRLFKDPSSSAEAERERVCDAFCQMYQEKGTEFPSDAQEAGYRAKLLRSYPIHPEVFDQLYSNWTTLERFQRTRGVLKMMSNAIHYLWTHDNQDLMILPGSLPLGDGQTQGIFTDPLSNAGWTNIISKDIDGDQSEAAAADLRNPHYGTLSACRKVTRTVFLATAPGTSTDMHRGLELKRLALGTASPGENPSVYRDALNDLCKVCHFLYADGEGRSWFGVSANLTTEMQSRRKKFLSPERAMEAIAPVLERALSSHSGSRLFRAVHVFSSSADIPDDEALRLVVVPLDRAWSSDKDCAAKVWAHDVLERRGTAQRNCRNRLIFLATDSIGAGGMQNDAATYLAWKEIVSDAESEKLNLDGNSLKEARSRAKDAERSLSNRIGNSFIRLMPPDSAAGFNEMEWDDCKIRPGLDSAMENIEETLDEQGDLITQWSPILLARRLEEVFWSKGKKNIAAMDFWKYCCSELAFPRLATRQVLEGALQQGAETRDYFGLALEAVAGGTYRGFTFGRSTAAVHLDESLQIISVPEAERFEQTKVEPLRTAPSRLSALLKAKWAEGVPDCPVSELTAQLQAEGFNQNAINSAVSNAVVVNEAALAAEKAADGNYQGLIRERNLSAPELAAAGSMLFVNPDSIKPGHGTGPGSDPPPPPPVKKFHQFSCTIEADPLSAKNSLLDALDALGILLTASGTTVQLQLDVSAESKDGFTEQQVRALKENLSAQGSSADFY